MRMWYWEWDSKYWNLSMDIPLWKNFNTIKPAIFFHYKLKVTIRLTVQFRSIFDKKFHGNWKLFHFCCTRVHFYPIVFFEELLYIIYIRNVGQSNHLNGNTWNVCQFKNFEILFTISVVYIVGVCVHLSLTLS